MRRSLALLALLVSTPALAAIVTVPVTGKILLPSGGSCTTGTFSAILNAPASAPDGATMQSIGLAEMTGVIAADGSVSYNIIANDIMTPTDRVYTFSYTCTLASGIVRPWKEYIRVPSNPTPTTHGALPRVNAPPGITIATIPAISGSAGTVVFVSGVGGGAATDVDLAWDATTNRLKFGRGTCSTCDAADSSVLSMSYIKKNSVDHMLWIDWNRDGTTNANDFCLLGEQEVAGGGGISADCSGLSGSITHFQRVTEAGRDYPTLQSGIGTAGARIGLAVGNVRSPGVSGSGILACDVADANYDFGCYPDLFDYAGWGGGGNLNTPYFGTEADPWYQIATNKILLEGQTKDAIEIFMTPDEPVGTDPQQVIPTYSGSIAFGIYQQTADITVANQAAETTLVGSGNGSLNINASVLRTGSTLTINASGFHGALATADPQIRIKLGGTTFCDTGATLDVPATTSQAWFATCTITIRGAPGAAVAAHGQGNFEFFSAVGTSKRFSTAKTSTSNLATNGALAVAVTVDWDAASATNTITATNLTASAIR